MVFKRQLLKVLAKMSGVCVRGEVGDLAIVIIDFKNL